MSDLPPTFELLVVVAGLWFLAGALARQLQRLILILTRRVATATVVYDLLVLPGVVLHELAHIVVATLLGVRVMRADLFRFRRLGDTRQGEVGVQRADPLRMSLIGVAPLLLGVPIVLLLARWLQLPPLQWNIAIFAALRPILRDPVTLLGLYLLWAVANAMFPSAADRAAWWIVGVVGVVVVGLGLLTGQRPAVPSQALQWLDSTALRLTSGLLPVLALDLVLLLVVVGLIWLARRVRWSV